MHYLPKSLIRTSYWIRENVRGAYSTDGRKMKPRHLVENCSPFYGTQILSTVFSTAQHWHLSWVRRVHSTSSHPISLIHVLTIFSHLFLGLSSTPYVFIFFYALVIFLPYHLFGLITLIISCAGKKKSGKYIKNYI